MTGRERIQRVLKNQAVDRIAWTTIADNITRSKMTDYLKEMPLLDFYRHIGCDIFQFGNYGLPDSVAAKCPYKLVTPQMNVNEYLDENSVLVRFVQTEWGNLTSAYKNGHPIKYPIQTLEDVKTLKRIWMNSRYVPDEEGCEESYAAVECAIGADGIFVPTIEPSPVQHLLELEMGTENFYYLLYDYQSEVAELISIMNEVRKQEYRLLASRMPFDLCIPVENTSTTYISPAIYRQYSLPYIKDFVEIMHSSGKKAIIHMCGRLYNLLDEIKETGLDGIHALTPPPIGDVSYEHALDTLGEELIIIGCLDSCVFQNPQASKAEIEALLESTLTPRVKKSNFILWPVVDGLPTEIERFFAVRDWFENNDYIG